MLGSDLQKLSIARRGKVKEISAENIWKAVISKVGL